MSLRILLAGNAPFVTSGYGVTTNNLANIFKNLGHEVGIFCLFGLNGAIIPDWNGFPLFPLGNQIWGGDIIWSHCKRFGADIVVSNIDTFVLNWGSGGYRPWIPCVPVAEDPLTSQIRGSLNGAFSLISISDYGKNTLQDAGYSSTMIPLPVDTGAFFPLDKRASKAALGFPEDHYLIGNIGMNRGSRKGHDILLRGFRDFLSEVPKAYLYIHTDIGQPDGLRLESMVNELGIRNNVRFPSRYDAFLGQPQPWMQTMLNALDLYVQPSTNEGQGMPVWEALSCSLPIVATECTALTEAVQGADAIGLPVVNKKWLQGEGYGYETSSEAVAQAMLVAYQKWGVGYVSAHNRQWAIEKVSLPVVGFQWQDFLLSIEKKIRFAPKTRLLSQGRPKLAMVSTIVPNCGVGAYTRMLNASVGEAMEVEPVDILSFKSGEGINADLVHIQHEPSIAPTNMVDILHSLRSGGHKVAITYHNIDPNVIASHLDNNLVDAAIIHWPPANNPPPNDPRIHVLGGMGVPTFDQPLGDEKSRLRSRFGFGDGDFIISTFGFASLGRGHFEVVEEMIPYLITHSNVKFQIVAPGNFLNEGVAQYVKQRLDAVREDYKLGNRIVFVGDFIPDREVIERLWVSDVGYLYLGGDTTSSSSAIRFFVSARLPLVITNSSHFADIRRGVVVVDGDSLPQFASDIIDLSRDQGKRQRLRIEHETTMERWAWPKFGERHLAIYRGLLGL